MELVDWIAFGVFAGLLALNLAAGWNAWRAARRGARADAWADYPLVPERCRD